MPTEVIDPIHSLNDKSANKQVPDSWLNWKVFGGVVYRKRMEHEDADMTKNIIMWLTKLTLRPLNKRIFIRVIQVVNITTKNLDVQ